MEPASRLLTTGEVARLCGFSPSAVLRWIHDGMLPAYSSPGGRHRVDPDQLLEFLKEHGMHVPAELKKGEEEPRRVLIVDDEEVVRCLLARMLEESELDCQVQVAESGIVACMALAAFRPHLIVLDVVMPDLDGAELCHVLRASREFADTSILLVTGYPDDERLRSTLLRDADGCLAKPVSAEEFVGTVRSLLSCHVPGGAAATTASQQAR